MNTKVLSDRFLQSMETEYKDVILPSLEDHGYLLIYPSIPDITDNEVDMVKPNISTCSINHTNWTELDVG